MKHINYTDKTGKHVHQVELTKGEQYQLMKENLAMLDSMKEEEYNGFELEDYNDSDIDYITDSDYITAELVRELQNLRDSEGIISQLTFD